VVQLHRPTRQRCGNVGTMIPAGTVERGERKRTEALRHQAIELAESYECFASYLVASGLIGFREGSTPHVL
jgi:hypothetical protein